MPGNPIGDPVIPVPRDEWDAVISASPDALAFHAPNWSDAVCASGSWVDATLFFRAASGGRLVVPMVRRSGVAGRLAPRASLPYGWGFGGVVASPETTPDEFRMVVAHLADSAGEPTTVRPNPLLRDRWAESVPAQSETVSRAAHVLDLEGGFERVFKERFKGRARTAVRKAERSGVTVERDTTGRLVPDFYSLYRSSLDRWAERRRIPTWLGRRLGETRDPRRKFEDVASRLREGCRIWLARVDDQPAAALICLVRGSNASYWRGCMDEERASRTQASHLLQKLAIEDACNSGCLHYHMGETGGSRSLAQFKEGFGARLHLYEEFRFSGTRPLRRTTARLASGLRRSA